MSQDISSSVHTTAEDVAGWDAIYLCAGLGVAELAPWVDRQTDELTDGGSEEGVTPTPPTWLALVCGPLLYTLCVPPSADAIGSFGGIDGCPVLKLRVFWLLQCWAFTLDRAAVEQVIRMLVHDISMAANTDLSMTKSGSNVHVVTQLQAINTLATMISLPNFRSSVITENPTPLLEGLRVMTLQLRTVDFRARVVEVLGEIIIVLGAASRSIASPLILHLWSLWSPNSMSFSQDMITNKKSNQTLDEDYLSISNALELLHPAILETTSCIVKSVGSLSVTLHQYVYPMVQQIVGTADQERHGFQQGITLWLTMVRNTYEVSVDMIQLLNGFISAIIHRGDALKGQQETIEFIMTCQSYIITGQNNILLHCGGNIMNMMEILLEQLSARSVVWVMKPVEALLLCCSAENAITLLWQTGFINKMLSIIAASINEFKPQFSIHELSDVALIEILYIFARIILLGSPGMLVLKSSAESLVGTSSASLLLGAVRLLIEKFDTANCSVPSGGRRKVWVMALLSLYPTNDKVLTECFIDTLVLADDLFCEMQIDEEELKPIKPEVAVAMAILNLDGEADVDMFGGDLEVVEGQSKSTRGDVEVEPVVEILQNHLLQDSSIISSTLLIQILRNKINEMKIYFDNDMMQLFMHSTESMRFMQFI